MDAGRIEEIARNLALGSVEPAPGNGAPAQATAPAGNVDLSEVDRYLESLKS